MASIRKTKKKITKNTLAKIWVEHAKFWSLNAVDTKNSYRDISRFFLDVDVNELSKITDISVSKLKKFIIVL